MAVFSPHDSFASSGRVTEVQPIVAVRAGIVPEWFHGVISRKAAENRLMNKPPGCFLVRVGESRVGYTLSYRGEDRSRHFMIDVLPGNQYVIVGERHFHSSLHQLVVFHRMTPFSPFGYVLTVACQQADKTNHTESFVSQRKGMNLNDMNCSTQRELGPFISEYNTSPTSPASPSAGLYPCLNTELSTLYPQSPEHPAKPVPNLRTNNNISTTRTQEAPPLVPPRVWSPGHPHAVTEVTRPPGPERQQPKTSLISLVQIKRKLKKKNSQPEEHRDVPQEPAVDRAALISPQSTQNLSLVLRENCKTASHRTCDGVPSSSYKPIEYLNPPPFAPGY